MPVGVPTCDVEAHVYKHLAATWPNMLVPTNESHDQSMSIAEPAKHKQMHRHIECCIEDDVKRNNYILEINRCATLTNGSICAI
ncbi:hypothetical protein ALC53_07999 [Atta colombica]|uniref:Uncharacterized protein n=1 Tax=Atta colombica TaxID=520822 RepID=A0A195BBL2_9HYME|nr:hypothetical protein ALC53_07999 [Atta colombica]